MGLVYPHIDIKDTEEASLLQLDATDNTVLVPVPYAKRYYMDSEGGSMIPDPDETLDRLHAKLYTSAADFIKEWSTGAGLWESNLVDDVLIWNKPSKDIPRYCFTYSLKFNRNSDVTIYDIVYNVEKSYLMVVELLKRGLPVLVKPIPMEFNTTTVINSEGEVSGDDIILPPTTGYPLGMDPWENIVFGTDVYFETKIEKAITESHAFDVLVDKNIYTLKFITSGAYPNIGMVPGLLENPQSDDEHFCTTYATLTELAEIRGDCISILDHKEKILTKEDLDNWFIELDTMGVDLSSNFNTYKLAAAFTPWCEFSIDKILPLDRNAKKFNLTPLTTMPAGFAYLMAYAYSIQTNASWWAAAGVMRGQVPQMIKPLFEIGESYMHILQGMNSNEDNYSKYNLIRFNPIMNTGSYGYRIWGNRMAAAFKDLAHVYKTMYNEFLNVRMLLCDIKKQIYAAAMRTTFEPNDDITWVSFKVLCSNLLDRMKSGRGLLWYKWHKEVSEERATIKAKLTVRPIEAVEHFDITVFLTDQDAEVEE